MQSIRTSFLFLVVLLVWGCFDAPSASAQKPPTLRISQSTPGELVAPANDPIPIVQDTITYAAPAESQRIWDPWDGAFWVQAEHLLWVTKGMNVPPLITEAPRGESGELGDPNTTTVFGNQKVFDDFRQGGRFRIGTWLGHSRWGIEGEYFFLENDSMTVIEGSGGHDRTVSRPFFDAANNLAPRAELVGFLGPGGVGDLCGSIRVDLETEFQGAGARLRTCGWQCTDPCGARSRLDWTLGYRFLRMDEKIHIHEDLTSLDPAVPNTAFDVFDQFDTENRFHGVEVGFNWSRQRARWSLEAIGRVAIGATSQNVRINGFTTITNTATGAAQTSTVAVPADGAGGTLTGGGLLAQRTNIGEYDREQFSVVPELTLNLGYHVNSRLKAHLGYNFLMWSSVVRPGDQIDLAVNPNLIPDEPLPFAGLNRPAFDFDETTFWAQGVNAGLTYVW